ncbi:BNR-4 repeat-containing protein [Lacinutrix cladophorae]
MTQRYLVLLLILFSNLLFSQKKNNSNKEEITTRSLDFQSVTFNGIWSWFSDPRAVYYEGKHKRTYTGWVDNYGDIHIAYYDHDNKKIKSKVIFDNLEIDDHNNPSLLIDKNGYITVFFNSHLQNEKPLYMVKSSTPERIDNWNTVKELFLNDETHYKNAKNLNHTYTNPIQLSAENDKIFLFWRGVDLKPNFATSIDNGETWSSGKILFKPNEVASLKVPYTKVYSDGVSKIHFTFTNGHPTQETSNAIYYMYYEAGAFYKADGTKIKTIDELPIQEQDLDVIYKQTPENNKVWNWDIAQSKNGNPIIVYAKFPDSENHIYCYAIWKNNKWHNYDLINSGTSFLDIPEGDKASEPNYSGGITIDHETPNTLYLSVKRNDFFEIEKWITKDDGKTWKVKHITNNSTKNNIRPFAIRNAKKDQYPQILWIQNTNYINYSLFSVNKNRALHFEDRYKTAIKMDVKYPKTDIKTTKEGILQTMRELADWQLENPSALKKGEHEYGIFLDGLKAFYTITNENRYKNEVLNILQYEEEVEFDVLSLENLIWNFNLGDNRTVVNRLNALNTEDIEQINPDIKVVTLSKLLSLINENDNLEKENLSQLYLKHVADLLKIQKNVTNYKQLYTNALSIYTIAKGINDGVIPISHKQKTIESWILLMQPIFEKKYKSEEWNIGISGAILLASNEIYNLLD